MIVRCLYNTEISKRKQVIKQTMRECVFNCTVQVPQQDVKVRKTGQEQTSKFSQVKRDLAMGQSKILNIPTSCLCKNLLNLSGFFFFFFPTLFGKNIFSRLSSH
uniref:Uncharacterized protein n=1 Tax=Opuntia streptacantha TaxID=393608 RepID=A0A7C8YSV2_OPUST